MSHKTFFKKKLYRSTKYLAFINSKPCIISGKKANAHHEPYENWGMSQKGPDNETLPLSPDFHTFNGDSRHNSGRDEFWERYGIDWRAKILEYQEEFKELYGIKTF